MKKYYSQNYDLALKPKKEEFSDINSLDKLYELFSKAWSEQTCAPRLRNLWNKNNITVGQCSITSLIIQDIYGGEVYGVPLEDGGFHCFNFIDGIIFDLTSSQFGDVKLNYTLKYKQNKDEQLLNEDKKARYILLKNQVLEVLFER